MKHEPLGTEYCPDCAIMKERMYQLEQWEKNLEAREAELDKELDFRYKKLN